MGLDVHLTRERILLSVDLLRGAILEAGGWTEDAFDRETDIWRTALQAIAEGKHGTDPPALIAEAALRTRELGL